MPLAVAAVIIDNGWQDASTESVDASLPALLALLSVLSHSAGGNVSSGGESLRCFVTIDCIDDDDGVRTQCENDTASTGRNAGHLKIKDNVSST